MIKTAIRVATVVREKNVAIPPQVVVLGPKRVNREYKALPIPWDDWADISFQRFSTWPRRRVHLP